MFREISLSVEEKRDLLNVFEECTRKSDRSDKIRVSEIRGQVLRFWDTEKAKEREFVNSVYSNVLLPLFLKFQRSVIPEDYNELFNLFRPLEVVRSNIHETFVNFMTVILQATFVHILLFCISNILCNRL